MADRELVDLRSDTFTQPTRGMREAIAGAAVGDDVFGEDPSVLRLEREAAELLGFEAALFVPSGTMGNQLSIHVQTRPGDDVLLEAECHVYLYELGAMAAWSGTLPRLIAGELGRITREKLVRALPEQEDYLARASLLILENSHNHAGGSVMRLEQQRELLLEVHSRGIHAHLDGARIFNAALALGVRAADVARGFDTVMFCLSKGLGAPVGSVLCGSAELIDEARVARRRMGGGMRQAGVLAAAGSFALEHHVERLAEDHTRARRLADALASLEPFRVDPAIVETNIVIAELESPERRDDLLEAMRARGLLALAMGPGRIRFVTHLDVDDAGIDRAIRVLRSLRRA